MLAGLQAAEADSCDAYEAGLLWDDLDIAESVEKRDVLACQVKRVLVGVREQALEGEAAAGVPQVAADQPGATLGTRPDLGRHWPRTGDVPAPFTRGRVTCRPPDESVRRRRLYGSVEPELLGGTHVGGNVRTCL